MNLDDFKEGVFHVWQPDVVSLLKADHHADEADAPWCIGGYASTVNKDRQDEVVVQKGLDFSEFVEHGWFNDNHSQATHDVLGAPDKPDGAVLKADGWFVKGRLFKHYPKARDIYTLAKSMEQEGVDRRLGFSIEGKIVERVGNRIAKALIRNVAITSAPVNTDCTWGLLYKSWATPTELKALDMGFQYPPEAGGAALASEDLEGGELRVLYRCPACAKVFAQQQAIEAHLKRHQMPNTPSADDIKLHKKSLTPACALRVVQEKAPHWDPLTQLAFVNQLVQRFGVEQSDV
jgi:hypothetical protein